MAPDRRTFLRRSLDVALLAAVAPGSVPTSVLAASNPPAVLMLFDGRFRTARQAALAWANGSAIRALGSDITDTVLELSTLMQASAPCRIAGVTTEHVPFCLQQLARHPTRARLTLQRMNRDLFAWTLTSEGTNT